MPMAHFRACARVIVAVLSLAAAAASQTTYYVDAVTGDDSGGGTSPSAAWKSLAKVSGTVFGPGDRILFRAGQTWTAGPGSSPCAKGATRASTSMS